MTDDDEIPTTPCASCETHIPESVHMGRCDSCQERCCSECLETNERTDRTVCAACRDAIEYTKERESAYQWITHGR